MVIDSDEWKMWKLSINTNHKQWHTVLQHPYPNKKLIFIRGRNKCTRYSFGQTKQNVTSKAPHGAMTFFKQQMDTNWGWYNMKIKKVLAMIVTLQLRRKTDMLQSDIVFFSIINWRPAKPEEDIISNAILTQQQQQQLLLQQQQFYPSLHVILHAVQNIVNRERERERERKNEEELTKKEAENKAENTRQRPHRRWRNDIKKKSKNKK